MRPKKITYGHLVSLGSRLTDRDKQIAADCYDHHVLTTQQLLRLHFDGLRSTTARLNILYQLRVLDRFRPSVPMGEGTAPYHWVLDEAGAHIVAAREEIERRSLRWRHSDAIRVAYSGKLRHHIEINEFFSLLSQEAEAKDGRLDQWYGERTTHKLFNGITPDGWGVLTLPHRPPAHLLLELDRGTEPTKRLREKAVRYAREIYRSHLGEQDAFVVLAVPTTARAPGSPARPCKTQAHRSPSPNGAWAARTRRFRSSPTSQTRSSDGAYCKQGTTRHEATRTAPRALPTPHAATPRCQTLEISARV